MFRTCENHYEIRADVAQLVEQRFRKPPVGSSSLPVGSVSSSVNAKCGARGPPRRVASRRRMEDFPVVRSHIRHASPSEVDQPSKGGPLRLIVNWMIASGW
jgi:hypothetical protein